MITSSNASGFTDSYDGGVGSGAATNNPMLFTGKSKKPKTSENASRLTKSDLQAQEVKALFKSILA